MSNIHIIMFNNNSLLSRIRTHLFCGGSDFFELFKGLLGSCGCLACFGATAPVAGIPF